MVLLEVTTVDLDLDKAGHHMQASAATVL